MLGKTKLARFVKWSALVGLVSVAVKAVLHYRNRSETSESNWPTLAESAQKDDQPLEDDEQDGQADDGQADDGATSATDAEVDDETTVVEDTGLKSTDVSPDNATDEDTSSTDKDTSSTYSWQVD